MAVAAPCPSVDQEGPPKLALRVKIFWDANARMEGFPTRGLV